MLLAETYLKIAREVGSFTKQKTGVNIVNAYFGPESLRGKIAHLEKLRTEIEESLENTRSLNNRFQGKFLREKAEEIMALCDEHGWKVIVGIEPDKPEDITDIERLLNPKTITSDKTKVG